MSNFQVLIKEVEIKNHPNADRLEIAEIRGTDYQSLVGIGEYETGDLVAYIPEDSIVPEWIQEKLGVKGKLAGPDKNRVRSVRLRGTFSQGLCYPVEHGDVSDFPEDSNLPDYGWVELKDGEKYGVTLGDDVKDVLGIEKYEPPIPVHMSGEVFNARGNTLKYDIDNFKKYSDVFDGGEEVVVNEKIHGCADYDVLVETLEYGMMKIGEIVENEIHCCVKSLNINTGEIEYKPIEGHSVMENNHDWYEIKLENGNTIKLTGNHPVWLPELKCYRRVDELSGDEEVEFNFGEDN